MNSDSCGVLNILEYMNRLFIVMRSICLKVGSLFCFLRILVCRYSCESFLYFGKKYFYGNGEGF